MKVNEFNTSLDSHPIKDGNVYRLYYMNYRRIGTSYCGIGSHVGVVDWPFKPFMLPDGMSREDAFKVLSYLTDYIEKNKKLDDCSFICVKMLDDILNIEQLGFKRLDYYNSDDIINLFTITGRVGLFKKDKLYKSYFEWYTSGVTLDEVVSIYKKYNIAFGDLKSVNKILTLKN